jgi:hypothetical protein
MMNDNLTEWQKSIERRLSVLEKTAVLQQPKPPETLELTILLPKADIDGLHFNRQEVRGVFDLKEDGKYHSRDILFLSARNTEDDNSRDILLKYLRSEEVQKAFLGALINADYAAESVEVSLPVKNEGVKKYNGVDYWYWLQQKAGHSAASFCGSYYYGYASSGNASAVGGCAPALSVSCKRHG